ncbi:hypothetical protein RFI_23220 [Reticulomyxa filosa]|uniref:Uncharacterized protein n=1 Tax=Reticulomyxa filosa TaxID=46433 RepID=X6MJV4_RETFI|nr:hypothetical protein RFI_23220 [Reticulomyxa filosa]|eukprot:ETO14149.1 hypothetical protein RFI_23220 [Reticulomyxa filosa]
MINQNFQTLEELPTQLTESQCVIYKHEILIRGCQDESACCSCHTLKNEYKFICEYPSDVDLKVQLVDNNNNNKDSNQITLLSFGGANKHILVMKYVSVWINISNKSNELSNYNQCVPFTYNHNYPVIIGRYNDNYRLMRALIGGISNIYYLSLIQEIC